MKDETTILKLTGEYHPRYWGICLAVMLGTEFTGPRLELVVGPYTLVLYLGNK